MNKMQSVIHRSGNGTIQWHHNEYNGLHEVTVMPREFGSASVVKILTHSFTLARAAYLNAVQEDLTNLNPN